MKASSWWYYVYAQFNAFS